MSSNPFLDSSFAEAIPGGLRLPEGWEFRKYYFDMPSLRGASGQGRLMYLVNRSLTLIELVWIYTHNEFEKRPPDKNLKQLIQELIESQEEEAPSENEDSSAGGTESSDLDS